MQKFAINFWKFIKKVNHTSNPREMDCWLFCKFLWDIFEILSSFHSKIFQYPFSCKSSLLCHHVCRSVGWSVQHRFQCDRTAFNVIVCIYKHALGGKNPHPPSRTTYYSLIMIKIVKIFLQPYFEKVQLYKIMGY